MIKELIGFGRTYYISDSGEIFNEDMKRMKTSINEAGYEHVKLGPHRRQKLIGVHRAVAKTFIENPNNYPEVNHKDGNKMNNRVDNLEWCTCKENIQHAIRNGLFHRNQKAKARLMDDGR